MNPVRVSFLPTCLGADEKTRFELKGVSTEGSYLQGIVCISLGIIVRTGLLQSL
jgi:hypothetical protein